MFVPSSVYEEAIRVKAASDRHHARLQARSIAKSIRLSEFGLPIRRAEKAGAPFGSTNPTRRDVVAGPRRDSLSRTSGSHKGRNSYYRLQGKNAPAKASLRGHKNTNQATPTYYSFRVTESKPIPDSAHKSMQSTVHSAAYLASFDHHSTLGSSMKSRSGPRGDYLQQLPQSAARPQRTRGMATTFIPSDNIVGSGLDGMLQQGRNYIQSRTEKHEASRLKKSRQAARPISGQVGSSAKKSAGTTTSRRLGRRKLQKGGTAKKPSISRSSKARKTDTVSYKSGIPETKGSNSPSLQAMIAAAATAAVQEAMRARLADAEVASVPSSHSARAASLRGVEMHQGGTDGRFSRHSQRYQVFTGRVPSPQNEYNPGDFPESRPDAYQIDAYLRLEAARVMEARSARMLQAASALASAAAIRHYVVSRDPAVRIPDELEEKSAQSARIRVGHMTQGTVASRSWHAPQEYLNRNRDLGAASSRRSSDHGEAVAPDAARSRRSSDYGDEATYFGHYSAAPLQLQGESEVSSRKSNPGVQADGARSPRSMEGDRLVESPYREFATEQLHASAKSDSAGSQAQFLDADEAPGNSDSEGRRELRREGWRVFAPMISPFGPGSEDMFRSESSKRYSARVTQSAPVSPRGSLSLSSSAASISRSEHVREDHPLQPGTCAGPSVGVRVLSVRQGVTSRQRKGLSGSKAHRGRGRRMMRHFKNSKASSKSLSRQSRSRSSSRVYDVEVSMDGIGFPLSEQQGHGALHPSATHADSATPSRYIYARSSQAHASREGEGDEGGSMSTIQFGTARRPVDFTSVEANSLRGADRLVDAIGSASGRRGSLSGSGSQASYISMPSHGSTSPREHELSGVTGEMYAKKQRRLDFLLRMSEEHEYVLQDLAAELRLIKEQTIESDEAHKRQLVRAVKVAQDQQVTLSRSMRSLGFSEGAALGRAYGLLDGARTGLSHAVAAHDLAAGKRTQESLVPYPRYQYYARLGGHALSGIASYVYGDARGELEHSLSSVEQGGTDQEPIVRSPAMSVNKFELHPVGRISGSGAGGFLPQARQQQLDEAVLSAHLVHWSMQHV